MGAYGQFCPIAKAMEVLDQRWTMLIVREMTCGSSRFNEIRRGVPKMSPALLSTRLRQLQRAGLVERQQNHGGITYSLTPAGDELREVLDALGRWGVRWIGELGDHDLDPHLLVWDMHRRVDLSALPATRMVLNIEFTDVLGPSAHWWMVLDRSAASQPVDVCDFDPGFGVDAEVATTLRALIDIWMGDRSWAQALRTGAVVVSGPARVTRAVPRWFKLSSWSDVPRPEAARQRVHAVG